MSVPFFDLLSSSLILRDRLQNPFTFRFPRNIDGAHLMMAAQTLSREVLNSRMSSISAQLHASDRHRNRIMYDPQSPLINAKSR